MEIKIDTEKNKLLADKSKEVERYRLVFAAYRGRWWHVHKAHLEKLEEELGCLNELYLSK